MQKSVKYTRNKKLLVTGASLLVTSALLGVKEATRGSWPYY